MCRKLYLFLVLISAVMIFCQVPTIFSEQTYFDKHQIDVYPQNSLANLSAETQLSQKGVFQYHFYAIKDMPALLFLNEKNQLYYLLLSDSISAKIGDYVRVSGSLQPRQLSRGTLYSHEAKTLNVSTVELLAPSNLILQDAKLEYSKRQKQLQEKIAVEGSKLKLPEQPEWVLVLDESRSNMIVYFTTADLMYAAEIDFVYNVKDGKLFEIYGKQWFKGE